MPLSSKILRGLDVKGWKTCYPRLEKLEKKLSPEPAVQKNISSSIPAVDAERRDEQEEEILLAAREEGEKLRRDILAEAVAEARLIAEKAREEGFQEGYRQGEKSAQELVEKARQTLKEAGKERQEILAEAEPEIISLALSIAEKLMDYTVNIDSRCILALIARGLRSLPAGEKVYIKVNPQDEKICRENFYGLQELVREGALLEIVADEKIAAGNCRLESEEVVVEMLLQKELQILGKKLLGMAVSSGQQYSGEID